MLCGCTLGPWSPRGHCRYSEVCSGGPCSGSPMTGPGLPPGALGPSRAVTSAKGHRHEEAWTPGPAQLNAQTADRAETVHWPGQQSARHTSWQSRAGFVRGTASRACQGLGMPGKDQRPRSSCPGSISLQYKPLASSLNSPLQSTPCLKANDFPLWKRCRYFYIFVWNCEKVKTCVYFVLVLTQLIPGGLWKDLSLFFI